MTSPRVRDTQFLNSVAGVDQRPRHTRVQPHWDVEAERPLVCLIVCKKCDLTKQIERVDLRPFGNAAVSAMVSRK